MVMNQNGMPVSRYATFRRLLSRLDHGTRIGPERTAEDSTVQPVRAMLRGLLSSRRRAHTRRLWARWLEPVMLRDPALLAIAEPLPGCVRVVDTAGWWPALSRRMDDLPATVQSRLDDRLANGALDRVLASAEMAGWAETLRGGSLSVLDAVRTDPTALALFLEEANAHRMRAASALDIPGGVAALRPLDGADVETLTAALRLSDGWRTLGGRAADMEIDELLACVRGALTGGSVAPDAMALFAVAGLYSRRDPLLGAALRALLPLPLVDAAAAWLTAHGNGGKACGERAGDGFAGMPPFGGGQAESLDRGLRDLFEAAMRSGRPVSPADAKRLGRALAGVVDDVPDTPPARR